MKKTRIEQKESANYHTVSIGGCPFPKALRLPGGKHIEVDFFKIFLSSQSEVMNLRKDISLLPEKISKFLRQNNEQIAKRITSRQDRLEAQQILTNQWLAALHSMMGAFLAEVESLRRELNEARDRFERLESEKRRSEEMRRLKKIESVIAESSGGSTIIPQLKELAEVKTIIESLENKSIVQTFIEEKQSEILQKIKGNGN